jgi:hypothetical protein
MWFNGSEISNKAQRALKNENITIVAHNSGYIHCFYKEATIDKKRYQKFSGKLDEYLSMDLSLAVFANFLRSNHKYQEYFQVCRDCHGQPHFLKAETLFHYEHGSNYRVADKTFDKLLADVSDEDFVPYELPGRIRCDQLDNLINQHKPDLRKAQDKAAFIKFIEPVIPDAEKFTHDLADFLRTQAKLPSSDKNFLPTDPIEISTEQSREQIINYLKRKRQSNKTADLAFYAYRDMESCRWAPFVKAALERNPVSLQKADSMSIEQVYEWLKQMPDDSIYHNGRLAQPDEVANYRTGDGLEKAFLLANIIHNKDSSQDIEIVVDKDKVFLKGQNKYSFQSTKSLIKNIRIDVAKGLQIIE